MPIRWQLQIVLGEIAQFENQLEFLPERRRSVRCSQYLGNSFLPGDDLALAVNRLAVIAGGLATARQRGPQEQDSTPRWRDSWRGSGDHLLKPPLPSAFESAAKHFF